MSTITKERLRERAREKVKSLEFAITQAAFADSRAELEEELQLARIALASLEAEPVASHEVLNVARAALDYIDALPREIVAALPAMPGFDRDWADSVLQGKAELENRTCKYCGGSGYFRWQQSANRMPCPCIGCTELAIPQQE